MLLCFPEVWVGVVVCMHTQPGRRGPSKTPPATPNVGGISRDPSCSWVIPFCCPLFFLGGGALGGKKYMENQDICWNSMWLWEALRSHRCFIQFNKGILYATARMWRTGRPLPWKENMGNDKRKKKSWASKDPWRLFIETASDNENWQNYFPVLDSLVSLRELSIWLKIIIAGIKSSWNHPARFIFYVMLLPYARPCGAETFSFILINRTL